MYEDTSRHENRDNAANDRFVGDTTQAKGRAKESWGALTGNERLKAEGEKDQMAGTARSRKGQWKERIKAWIDRF